MKDKRKFCVSAENFKKIPGAPLAYWVGVGLLKEFERSPTLKQLANPRKGLATTDNARFLRKWFEIGFNKILVGCHSAAEAKRSCAKWFPLNKGGEYRRWYGNNDWMVNWENDGKEMKNAVVTAYNGGSYTKEIRSEEKYFQDSITWSALTAGDCSFRLSTHGALFDSAGSSMFPASETLLDILALVNAKPADYILNILNPTMNYGAGTVGAFPCLIIDEKRKEIIPRASTLVTLSRADWDEYETSWDFKVNPLVREGWQRNGAAMSMETAWAAVFARRLEWAERMKTLEEENNRLFIEAYGLQDELKPDVAWKDVSITGNPAYRYKLDGDPQSGEERARADAMRELISYGMGVLMGRYSLEQEGLILASQGELYKDYIARVHGAGKILPDEDGVIPAIALEGGFFKDNLLHRMREFLSVAFGNDALPQNLNFIEAALGCGFDKYLTDKFFDDHVKTYKKRPIYWLFESPKGYFRAFAYMHRMTGATAGHIRNNYLLPYIGHLEKCFAAEVAKGSSMTSAERKRVKAMEAAIKDCKEYDLVLHKFAEDSVAIDLDDGVVVNWKKYESVLAKL